MRAISARILLPVVILLAAVAAGFIWYRQAPSSSAPPGPPEKIRIANIGMFSNYNIIAANQGFFRAEGLDAEVDEYDSGATSMGALESGKADIAVAASFVGVSHVFKDGDLRILATVSSHDVWRVVARADKGIAKPSDLKGKQVGVTLKTAGEFYFGKFLTANGLKREDITVVDLSASDIASRLQDGSIDAGLVFDPNAYHIQQALAGNAVAWSAQGNRRELATVYTTSRFVADHPEAAARYVQALVDAERWQDAHQDESKRVLAGTLSYDAAYMDHLWTEFDFTVRLDQELLVTMEDQARWIIGTGLAGASRVPDYLGYIAFGPLEKADPSSVTIIHQP